MRNPKKWFAYEQSRTYRKHEKSESMCFIFKILKFSVEMKFVSILNFLRNADFAFFRAKFVG